MKTYFFKDVNIGLDLSKEEITDNVTKTDLKRFLKGKFSSIGLLKEGFTDPVRECVEENRERGFHEVEDDIPFLLDFLDDVENTFDELKPFSYKEAFEINNQEFQMLVFGSINIQEMISELGTTEANNESIELNLNHYDDNGNLLGKRKSKPSYSVLKSSGEKLGIEGEIYCVQVTCPSQNTKAYLWINDEFKGDALTAISSTFMLPENIKALNPVLKRQGDVYWVELNKPVIPEGELKPLTNEEYFKWLKSES